MQFSRKAAVVSGIDQRDPAAQNGLDIVRPTRTARLRLVSTAELTCRRCAPFTMPTAFSEPWRLYP